MAYKAKQTRLLALALTTALATSLVSGCTTKAAPSASASAAQAQTDLARGKSSSAVGHAESAVKADPQNAGFRAGLGAAYMDAGRFQSAATSFNDAISLGDKSSRTALSYALAQIAANKPNEAIRVLNERKADLNAADVGLAMSLAGDPNKGVRILSDAIRGGQNTAKVRQNLAYSYALQGNWRAARLMAAEDVPATEINDRIGEWALAAESQGQVRVAKLLGVPVVGDKGMPVALALTNNPSQDSLVNEAAGQARKTSPEKFAMATPVGNELPPARTVSNFSPATTPVNGRTTTSAAPPERVKLAPLARPTAAPKRGATPARANSSPARANSAPRSKPRVAQVAPPVRRESAFSQRSSSSSAQSASSPRPSVSTRPARPSRAKSPAMAASRTASQAVRPSSRSATRSSAQGSHLVQLGSFSSRAGAERAWGIYLKRYPHLRREDLVISTAKVRGKNYFRVSASGFDKGEAKSLCYKVKSGGHDCFAWASNSPLPGAIDIGIRMAQL